MNDTFYHGSSSILKIGKTYKARKNMGTFGDIERIVEHNRPDTAPSRLHSFFCVSQAADVKSAGGTDLYVYKVRPLISVARCNFQWFNKVVDYAYEHGDISYEQGYGYRLSDLKDLKKLQKLKEWSDKYFNGAKHSGIAYGHSIEYLIPEIEVLDIHKASFGYDDYMETIS